MLNFKSKLSSDNNIIHDTAIVDKSVKLGKNNFIGAFVVITGDVEIGDNNRFESHISIGAKAQHRLSDKSFGVKIGSNNVFREFVTVHSGIQNVTKIGNNCYFMNYSHIPHDAILGNDITVANSVQMGGHTIIDDYCNIGLNSTIHQFSHLGEGSMLGMGCVVTKNKAIEPYTIYVGNPCHKLKDNDYLIKKNNVELFDLLELRKRYCANLLNINI